MFRKLALALVATTAIGAAALTPTTASAGWKGWHHGHHHHFHGHGLGFGFGYSPIVVGGGYYEDGGCYQTRRVMTPKGPRWRTVNVCAY